MIKKNATELNQASNRILVGTSIEGEINSNGDFRVDGKIKGSIEITGKLVIGEKGMVDGEVSCSNANISGSFKGALHVKELLSLQSTAKLNGDVVTAKLSVEPGAEFTGSCKMGAVVRDIHKNGESKKATQREKGSVTA
jgi:cytoskeletal protein CcmA (bactofilin family)